MRKILLLSAAVLLVAAGCSSKPQTNGSRNRPDDGSFTPQAQADNSNLSEYSSTKYHFSMWYPNDFKIDAPKANNADWSNTLDGKGLRIVTVTIPGDFEPQTNFVDGKVNVGVSSDTKIMDACLSAAEGERSEGKENVNGTLFYKFSSTGAAAGNLYQTETYRGIYMSKCYSLEAVVHSGNIQNYDPSLKVTEFDFNRIRNSLYAIVHSFVLQ